MLAQPVFALSVIGQVFMGTIYVFTRQAVQECYVVLSHDSLALFRHLEFIGSIAFNGCMAGSAALSVLVYESVGETAPFHAVAAFAGTMSLVVVAYFLARLRGRLGVSFTTAEKQILEERKQKASCARRACERVAPCGLEVASSSSASNAPLQF